MEQSATRKATVSEVENIPITEFNENDYNGAKSIRKMSIRKILRLEKSDFAMNPRQLDESSACTICMNIFKNGDLMRSLQCKHLFHKNCLFL